MNFSGRLLLLAAALVSSVTALGAAGASVPANLGGGLRQLVREAAAIPPQGRAAAPRDRLPATHPRAQGDAAGRVVVDVHLDGTRPVEEMRAALERLGATIINAVRDRSFIEKRS